MANTTNLEMVLLEVGQKEKEAAINVALNTIDGVLLKSSVITIPYAASITPSATAAISKCTLTGNVTINLPATRKVGKLIRLFLIQDATGSRTITWATGYKLNSSSSSPSTAANAIDLFALFDDGTNIYVTLDKGY